MALDSYLVTRLCRWARWASRGDDGGVGFARKCSFVNVMPRGEFDYDVTLDVEEDCMEIDLCVQALSVENSEAYAALYAHYRRNDLKVDEKLRYLGCSKQTYYNKIDAAHRLILGWLNDLACGVGIPAAENNFNKFKKIA